MQINVVCLENMFATNGSEPFMQINVLCLENMFATNGSEPFMQINQIIDLIFQDEGTLDEMASNHFVWPRTILMFLMVSNHTWEFLIRRS